MAYGHDTRGNVTSIGTFNLDWNRANELISDHFGTHYAYDARGWRIKQHITTGGEHTRYFLYDASHRLIERIDNGVVTDFVHVADRTIARVEGGTATYILGDYQNTPLFETSVAARDDNAPQVPGSAGRATRSSATASTAFRHGSVPIVDPSNTTHWSA